MCVCASGEGGNEKKKGNMTEMDINLEARKFGKLIKETKKRMKKKVSNFTVVGNKKSKGKNPARGAVFSLNEQGKAVNNNAENTKVFKTFSFFLFGKRIVYSDYTKIMSIFNLIRNFSEAFFTYKEL